MKSYRWYALALNGRALATADIAALPASESEANFWFSFEQVHGAAALGRFNFRHSFLVERVHGGINDEVIELVSSVDVAITSGVFASVVRISDSGRGAKRLIEALTEIFGFGFSVSPMKTLDGEQIVGFNSSDFDDCKMVSLKVTNVRVADGVIARMEFASRQGMSLEELDDLKSRNFSVDSVKYEVLKAGVRGSIAATSSGRAIVSGSLAPFLSHILDKAMRPS
ncbi:hypothetical protein [Xanthomonas sacchari]|uniref:hypothetical protein n=1 Tax=Xanthomonas sacchari TaxID=56458 RepID=UPI00111008C0|nr:hypothetical protein [Xanthomonas sacchari]MDV0440323.1 hypothetical protein [Xanthomonas sacchari]